MSKLAISMSLASPDGVYYRDPLPPPVLFSRVVLLPYIPLMPIPGVASAFPLKFGESLYDISETSGMFQLRAPTSTEN